MKTDFWQSLKIRTRIMLLVGVFFGFIASLIVVNVQQLGTIRRELRRLSSEELPLIKNLSEVTKSQLEQAISFQRAMRFGKFMVVNNDAKRSFFSAEERFNTLSILVQKSLGDLIDVVKKERELRGKEQQKLVPPNDFLKVLELIRVDHHAYTESVNEIFQLMIAGEYEDIEAKARALESKEDALNTEIRYLLKQAIDHGLQKTIHASEHEQLIQKLMLVISVLALVIAFFLGISITRSILNPLRVSVIIAQEIGLGNRTPDFPAYTPDEMGELLQTMRTMLGTIRLSEKQLLEANEQLELKVQNRTHELALKNEMLDKTNHELKKLNETKNQFLGMAAHDLRNPISIIMGYAQLITTLHPENLKPDQVKMLEKIQKSCQNMLALINDLLDLSAIEAGTINLKPSQVSNLGEFLNDCIESHRLLAKIKNIEISFNASNKLPSVTIDRDKMAQVLGNLLSNAIKYSHPNTKITLDASDDQDKIKVNVTDQGQGIPESELGKLFNEFSKTSVKSTAGEKSTGLGLAIVRKIVKAHGGDVSVKSKVGSGSTFSFTLPTSHQ